MFAQAKEQANQRSTKVRLHLKQILSLLINCDLRISLRNTIAGHELQQNLISPWKMQRMDLGTSGRPTADI